MKTLGRILIILVAFALVMGIIYMTVNAVRPSGTAPAFTRGDDGFPRPEGGRSPFSGGEGRDGRGGSALRLIGGFIRNVGIVALIVILVVWWKDFLEKRARTT